MELVNLYELQDFQNSKVIKKIPIISDSIMSTIFFIGPNTNTPIHKHIGFDEIYYIINGTGKIVVDDEPKEVNEGMIIMVPKTKSHNFTTSEKNLTILSFNTFPERKANKKNNTGTKIF
jgi:mannose-6-phosphate isomerase-like protein (cupin superfamily)